jgi:hypothetical protein
MIPQYEPNPKVSQYQDIEFRIGHNGMDYNYFLSPVALNNIEDRELGFIIRNILLKMAADSHELMKR